MLEYFDAFLIGLTATPSKQTLGFFKQQLVSEYPYEASVAHDVNVPYEVFKIRTVLSTFRDEVRNRLFPDRSMFPKTLVFTKDHLGANLTIEEEDFEYSPFEEKGGIYRAYDLFDQDELNALLDELNEVVTA